MKNLYIWESIDNLTDNWHDGGGLVIISDLTSEAAFKKAIDDEHVSKNAEYVNPTHWFKVESLNEAVFAFPDSGCC